MAEKKPAAAAAKPAAKTKTINRLKRSALERKSLTRNSKVLFKGMGVGIMKMMLASEKHERDTRRKGNMGGIGA